MLPNKKDSELNLKAIFRPERFRDAPNNQRMESAPVLHQLLKEPSHCIP